MRTPSWNGGVRAVVKFIFVRGELILRVFSCQERNHRKGKHCIGEGAEETPSYLEDAADAAELPAAPDSVPDGKKVGGGEVAVDEFGLPTPAQ